MRIEITVPSDRTYVERLFDCLEHIEKETPTLKSKRLRDWIFEEFRRIRAKYNGNPRLDMEAIIEKELSSPVERPLYVNTKLDKLKVARFDPKLETTVDRVARMIREKNDGRTNV